MKITVCGLGKIGRPIYNTLSAHHEVVCGYDADSSKCIHTLRECVEHTDAAIFVVQTPSLPDGSFSNEHLKKALESFRAEAVRQKKDDFLYVITSTVVPGTCEKLRKSIGENLVYNPLFVRLEHVYEDLENPEILLVGATNNEAARQWLDVWPFDASRHRRMSLTEAELCKITLNIALTVKISLANQLHLVAKRMNCDSKKIMEAVGCDPRIGLDYLKPGWPYGGPCLPRDNRMFQFVAKQVGIDAALSRGADEINNRIAHED